MLVFLPTDGIFIKIDFVGIDVGVSGRVRGVSLFYFSFKFSVVFNNSHNGFIFLVQP